MDFDLNYDWSEHENIILRELSSKPEKLDKSLLSNKKVIFVCFTNRSGSNWLCELLSQHDAFNQSSEFFNHPMVLKKSKKYNLNSIEEYFNWLLENKSSKSGVLICKVGWAQLYFLARIGIIKNLKSNVQYIHIERKDKISQAISFYIASKTKKWKSYQKVDTSANDITYDRSKLIKIITGLVRANMMFKLFFQTYSIKSFKLTYEQLISNTQNQINDLLIFLGVESLSIIQTSQKMQIQRDELNKSLKKKFIQDSESIV